MLLHCLIRKCPDLTDTPNPYHITACVCLPFPLPPTLCAPSPLPNRPEACRHIPDLPTNPPPSNILSRYPSQRVRRAPYSAAAAVEYVRVYHGRAHVLVPEEFLDRADVVTVLQ